MSNFSAFAEVFSRLDSEAIDTMYKGASADPWKPPGGQYSCLNVGWNISSWNDEKNSRVVPILDLNFKILEADTGVPSLNARTVGRDFRIGFFLSPGKEGKQSFGASRFKGVVEKMFESVSGSLEADARRVCESITDTVWKITAKESLEHGTDLKLAALLGTADETSAEAAAG
ncbi:hypothetical protein LCGC14_0901850 [marine sediment metagenome]|uniref:Uncharacterized protein n=1 Tax=marine sediment metagenome TaxID=412755 RepID=A0A0F9RF99_9ZZZZ